jgi:hypothetical protein
VVPIDVFITKVEHFMRASAM